MPSEAAEAPRPDIVSSMAGKIKRDILVYGPALLIPAILNLLSTKIFTTIFSPGSFGDYALLLNTTLLLTTLISQWMQQSVQRYRPMYKNENQLNVFNYHLRTILLTIIVALLVLSAALYPVFRSYASMGIGLYACVFAILVFQTVYLVCGAILQSDLNSKIYRKVNILNAVLKLGLAMLMIYLVYKDTISIFVSLVVTYVIILAPMLKSTLYQKTDPSQDKALYARRQTIDFAKKFAYYGFPMVGWFLGNSLLNLCDRYIIGFFYSSREVGIYIANYSIVTSSIGLICSPLLTAAHPLFMNAANQSGVSTKQFEKLITMFSKVLLLFTIPIVGFVTVYRYEICDILLGKEYKEGALIIPLALVSLVLWNLSMYGHKGYEVKEKTRWMLAFVIAAAAFNTALNFILVPMIGYLGAAIAAIGGTFSYCFLTFIYSRRFIRWRLPWAAIGKSVLTTGILMCVLMAIRPLLAGHVWISLIAGGMIALLLYAAGLALTKEIDMKRVSPMLQKLLKSNKNKKILESGMK
jgi:O-antigen/teichoic acid export membrane protein